MDKFTTRGTVYATLSSLGLGYELVFVDRPRLFLIVMYSIVLLIGMVLIVVLKTDKEL